MLGDGRDPRVKGALTLPAESIDGLEGLAERVLQNVLRVHSPAKLITQTSAYATEEAIPVSFEELVKGLPCGAAWVVEMAGQQRQQNQRHSAIA